MKYHFYGYSCQVTKIDTLYFNTNYNVYEKCISKFDTTQTIILLRYIDLTELNFSYCLKIFSI